MELAEHRLEPRLLELVRGTAHRVRIETERPQLLACLGNTDPALGECHGAGAEDRPVLHEPAVGGDECDRNAEREERDDVAVVVPRDRAADDRADDRSGQADRDRQPDRHRVRPGQREARQATGDEAAHDDREDEADAHALAPTSAFRSRRISLISSRNLAAYSKRSSSAAWNISSSRVTNSFSSSSRSSPSTFLPPRRRERGTCGCSRARNSAMSETPLVIEIGLTLFSSL